MAMCKACGGDCTKVGENTYRCNFCGATFEDAPKPVKAAASAPVSSGSSSNRENLSGADVYEMNIGAILEVFMQTGTGSGYLISGDGYGITNSHVVSLDNGQSCRFCKVRVAGEVVDAQVVAMGTTDNRQHCSNNDLALIRLDRVPTRASVVKFGDYSSVRNGENVFVIGNSMGEGTCITGGIVSDKDRDGQLMYDCATNPGNSGGPVFNCQGKVIGTHVRGYRDERGIKAQGMNSAIPVTAVKDFLRRCGISIR